MQGVMEICLETIANDDVEAKMGPLTTSAIELAIELQIGGNPVTQASVARYINSQNGAKVSHLVGDRTDAPYYYFLFLPVAPGTASCSCIDAPNSRRGSTLAVSYK